MNWALSPEFDTEDRWMSDLVLRHFRVYLIIGRVIITEFTNYYRKSKFKFSL